MSLSGAQRYTFEELREEFNNELLNKNMPERLYRSTDGIMRIINAIVKTNGQGWAAQVLNNDGKPLLTKDEQIQFTDAFQPYLETIIDYFSSDDIKLSGGQNNPTVEIPGPDDIYAKIINKIGNVDSTVNSYASKYGILKLEKEYDLEEDIRLIPKPVQIAIATAIFGLTETPPEITEEILNQIKIPFRLIITTIFMILDIARLGIGVAGPSIGRKILSILLAILELLRGDWKKAILTFIGYYGMIPMFIGQSLKVFISLFEMFAPQIQHSIVFGSLDATKSLIVGLLLSIFQITAPEEIRLPLINILEKVAQHKAKMDGTLENIGLSARPDYLSPNWEDLNNIQAVINDKAYICSCEFKELVKAVNTSAIIRIVLQILRIPVTQDMVEYQCGSEPCKDFVTTVVKEAKDESEQEQEQEQETDAPFSEQDLRNPVDLNPSTSITAPITPLTQKIKTNGGRILHSRLKKIKP
jgi:hypothetical protein